MLAKLLDLRRLDATRFLAQHHQESFRNSLFGGQVLAQALMAAGLTTDERPPNSIHAYFLRAGVADRPIEYQVTVLRDGKSVSTRTINALQNDELIFSMSASFHQQEQGFHHQTSHPKDSIPPEVLLNDVLDTSDLHLLNRASKALGSTPIDVVPYNHDIFSKQPTTASEVRLWIRSAGALPAPVLSHYCALAFASDIGLLATSLLPHNASLFDGEVFPASMDHSLWFHNPPNFEHWHQYVINSPWADHARALCQGSVYDINNRLLASVSQEGLIRPLTL